MRVRTALALCFMACSCQGSPSGGVADASGDDVRDAVVDTVSDASGDASNDASNDASGDAPQDPGTEAGSTECNALANVGAVVRQMYVATRPATGNGGALVAGTYVLTAAVVYTGPGGGDGETGTTVSDTLALSDEGAYERVALVMESADVDGTSLRQNGRFTTDGGSLRVTQTCPPGRQPFTSYDSDGTRFRIYAPDGRTGPGAMFEYTRR